MASTHVKVVIFLWDPDVHKHLVLHMVWLIVMLVVEMMLQSVRVMVVTVMVVTVATTDETAASSASRFLIGGRAQGLPARQGVIRAAAHSHWATTNAIC